MYVGITVLFFVIMELLPESWSPILRMGLNSLLIVAFVAHVVYHDMPLRNLPVVGKYFR